MSEGLLEGHRDRLPQAVVERFLGQGGDPAPLILAWELSGLAPDLDPAGRESLFAIALALLAAQGAGHTRLDLGAAEAGAGPLAAVDLDGAGALDFLAGPALAELVGVPADVKPLILDGARLYSRRLLGHEQDLAALVRALAGAPAGEVSAVPEELFQAPVALNGEQRLAVSMALGGGLTLITGGPGTGKTSIVISILRALLRQPGLTLEDIALAAPTGKAAQRMGEAIRTTLGRLRGAEGPDQILIEATLEPRTLHRLLAWHPAAERFRHNPGNPIPAKVVIVDEASMVSQEHLCRLLGALQPGARLVLLGDADQLPSVEAGCAFRDLVASLPGNRVELLTSYRMSEADPDGRNILSVARAIRDPRSGSLWDGPEPIQVRASAAELTFRKVELLEPGPAGLRPFLERWFAQEVTGLAGFPALAGRVFDFRQGVWPQEDVVALGRLFDHFDRFRILCALREAGDLRGVEEINALLHGWMLRITGDGLKGLTPFCAGEPVLMTSNDYRRGIFNGDQGLILKVRFEDQLRQAAVFPRLSGFLPFPLEPLKHQLEHAYAMTVHKSQGSEYDRIALVTPRSNHRLLTRELLYTGLTRARKAVILLAERERIPFAAGNPTVRDTGLAERLAIGGTVPDRPGHCSG